QGEPRQAGRLRGEEAPGEGQADRARPGGAGEEGPGRKEVALRRPRVRMDGGRQMPRIALEPRFQVEHLSVLDSEGNLDTDLEPKLSADELKSLYRAMVLGRRLDERMVRLQRQGRIGTFAPIKGQEASQMGTAFTLRPADWMVPSFRELAAMI